MGLVVDGKLAVREGKREWLLEKEEMYLINAMEAHEFVARDPHTLILAIQVSPKLMTSFLPNAALIRYQTDPPLSSIHIKKRHAGIEAAQLLIKRIENENVTEDPQQILMEGRLVVRQSTVASAQEDWILTDW